MKTLLFGFAAIFFYTPTFFAQHIQCREKANRDPIPGVRLTDQHKHIAITDNNGNADISGFNVNDSILLTALGYYTIKTLFPKLDTVILMQVMPVQLEEVVSSAHRMNERWSDLPYTLKTLKKSEIEFVNAPQSADLLLNTGMVFVQKSQLGGGSPVLRGFEANKVLLVIDGIRMNNAIYRAGHLQDVIGIDAQMLDRVEILFGPSSTVYGSDALGGVMHFFTKQAQFSNSDAIKVHANAFTRFASVNNEQTAHADVSIGGRQWGSITNISYSQFGDLRSGTQKYGSMPQNWDCKYYVTTTWINNKPFDSMQVNLQPQIMKRSGYSQYDVMQRFLFKTGKLLHDFNFQYSQSSPVNRYDRLSEISSSTQQLKFAEWNYGPQKRLLAAYTTSVNIYKPWGDHIRSILSYQKIDQDRISRAFKSSKRISQMEDVDVLALNLDINKNIFSRHELRYGMELTFNNVTSTAHVYDFITGSTGSAKTRYGDAGNSMYTQGFYITYAWEIQPDLIFHSGARLTANQLESIFKDTSFYRSPILKVSLQNEALCANVGITWKSENDYKFSVLANSGFRSPNVDDLSKLFESNASVLIVPNPNLKPEYVKNLECNLSKSIANKFRYDMALFFTQMEQVMVTAPYTKLNGTDTMRYNGSVKKIQALQNQDRAFIYGAACHIQYQLNQQLMLYTQLNYTYGRYSNLKSDTLLPLDHIPPLFGQCGMRVYATRFETEGFLRFNAAKASADYSLSGEDNAVYSANIIKGYTPAWFTLNLRFAFNFNENFRLNAACENLTDARYRVFASGINAPGRNFIISLRYKF